MKKKIGNITKFTWFMMVKYEKNKDLELKFELKNIEEDSEPMAKTRKGKGLNKKPTKRRDKVSQSDKKKDRLRLVISQI